MRMNGTFTRRLAAFALAVLASAAVLADDLPGRVGRLADVGGRVYLATEQRAEDWLDAYRNDSVTSGDNLWVAGDGRAEIDYGGGQVRLAGDTNVHVARLDDAVLALFVAQGRVIVRVRVLDAGEAARIDTPNTQIALTRPGLYRIDVSADRTRTELVVREGEATASFATGIQQVLPGQTALLESAEPSLASVRNGFYVDGFDTWSADRDRRYERSRSTAYVSRQMIGYADLDEHGQWESVPEYGALWYPGGLAPDWAPYRYGRWAWVGGWGWTWVDDAAWGYAPFHYGRWVWYGGRWGWAPGAWVARPLWAPAMVAWYGGSGWSISATYGAPVYGWVPLSWGEPYVPWWGGCSRHCWTHYNRPYAVNIAERPNAPPTRFANWASPGGVTAVAGATFTGRRPVHANLVDLRPRAVQNAPVLAHAPVLDKPTPGRVPGARIPGAAPLPAGALQTRPMRLPPAPALVRSGEGLGVPPGSGARTGGVDPRPSGAVTPAAASGARPAPRAPVNPGTWGATGQTAPTAVSPAAPGSALSTPPVAAPPSSGQAAREPRAPWGDVRAPGQAAPPPGQSAAPGTSAPVPRTAPPVSSAPPAQYAPPAPAAPPAQYRPPAAGAPPAHYPSAAGAQPPRAAVPATPAPLPPSGAVVPRTAPPGSPGSGAVVPAAPPPSAAPPPAVPAPAVNGRGGMPVLVPDTSGRGDAPGNRGDAPGGRAIPR